MTNIDFSSLSGFSDLTKPKEPVSTAEATGRPLDLALDLLDEDPRNARRKYDPQNLQELAESIKAGGGVTTPIVVKVHPDDPARYRIVHGHRRFRASKLVQMSSILAVITDTQDAASQLVDNMQREDLTVLEIVGGIETLLADGLKQTEIAARLGKSKAWVSKHVALTELPPELKELLTSERCRDASTLYEALQCYKLDAEAVRKFLADAGERQIVQADVEAWRAEIKRALAGSGAPANEQSPSTLPDTTSAAPTMGEEPSVNASAADPATEAETSAAIQSGTEAAELPPTLPEAGASDAAPEDPSNDAPRQNVQPVKPTPDPTKNRKPMVQVRVGRREAVLLIGRKTAYGLALVQYEDGTEEEVDVNKIKLVAVTDAAK